WGCRAWSRAARAKWTSSPPRRRRKTNASRRLWTSFATALARTRCSDRASWGGPGWSGTGLRLVTRDTPMSRSEKNREFSLEGGQDGQMASNKGEAAGAAWEGADLERTIVGEDPTSDSL